MNPMKTIHILWAVLSLMLMVASCDSGPTAAIDVKQRLLGNWYLISVKNFTTKYTFISIRSDGNCYYSSSPIVDENSYRCFWNCSRSNTFRLYSNSAEENYSFTLEFAVNDDLILNSGNATCIYRRYQNERDLEMTYRVMGFWQLTDATDATLRRCAYLEVDFSGQGRAYDANLLQIATFSCLGANQSVTLFFDQQVENLTLTATIDDKGLLQCTTSDGQALGSYTRSR